MAASVSGKSTPKRPRNVKAAAQAIRALSPLQSGFKASSLFAGPSRAVLGAEWGVGFSRAILRRSTLEALAFWFSLSDTFGFYRDMSVY